ncbi:MAG: hypothetical protein M1823_005372 [Watsoniomyces obsoletus]|nr:MAG: hypothetical protein M1823_005372 [Watsoniomyces obsoletus]
MGKEMKFLSKNLRQLLGSGHPMLDTVAKYYAQSDGKRIRPLVVLLMARATSAAPKHARSSSSSSHPTSTETLNQSIAPFHFLADLNPWATTEGPLTSTRTDDEQGSEDSDILPGQRRLAEITELIHTASLLHDDVIDEAGIRRSRPSANIAFGNKMAVLGGDFLLGRASVALARLRDPEVVELLATVIANLVEGEFMQLKNSMLDPSSSGLDAIGADEALSLYLRKTYLKSASLISKSCRASALLGQCAPEIVDAAYAYGKNLGMAFQLVDDLLDYTITADELGKPAGADLELGLVTAPLLFAWKTNDELGPLVARRFQHEGDIDFAKDLVRRSDGVEQTRALAQDYADQAIQAIRDFPVSEAKDGLMDLCHATMTRRK